jgi:hypothetical protein
LHLRDRSPLHAHSVCFQQMVDRLNLGVFQVGYRLGRQRRRCGSVRVLRSLNLAECFTLKHKRGKPTTVGFVLAPGAAASNEAQPCSTIRTPQDQTAAAEKVGVAMGELSLFAASYIASDGNVIAKETEHFPSRVRPSRIGIGSGGTATRPSVAGSMDAPLLQHCPPVGIGMDCAGIGMPIRHATAIHFLCHFEALREQEIT